MNEFFISIGTWFVEKKDAIIAFFMSGTFTSICAAIFIMIRQFKTIKNNTSSTDKLNTGIEGVQVLRDTVTSIRSDLTDTQQAVLLFAESIKKQEEETMTALDGLTNKLNSMLEVQSIVYSTIKDDKMRTNVNTLLLNAKYSETSTRAQLQQEITDLKNKITTQTEDITKTVTDTQEKISSAIGVAAKVEQKIPARY